MSYKISCYDIFKLGEYTEIQPGYAFKSDQFLDDDTQVPLVKGENLQQGYVDWSASKYWRKEEYQDFEKYHLLPGDVIIAMDRPWVTAGLKWSYIKNHDPKSLLVQRVARLRGKDGLSQSFLKVLISSDYFSCYVQPIVTGVNVPHISGKQIADFKAPIPPLVVQNKIAAILSSYDDLIENNKCRIAILEKMAEEIYREWFVRFRFPGYQDAEFEKGIPKGWESLPSDEVIDVLSGGTPKTDNPVYWDGDIPFFTPKDAGDGYYCFSTEKSITDAGLEKCNSRLYPKQTIFITARGTVGKISLASKAMAMNQSCYALRPKDGEHSLFWFLSMKNAVNQIKGVSKSGVFDNIVADTFKIILLLRPKYDVLTAFNNLISPLFKEILVLSETNINLEKTKSLLLPRLISGKLSIEDLDIEFPPSMQEVV